MRTRSHFRVAVADAAQWGGIIVPGQNAGGHDRLIKAQARGFVHGSGVAASATEVFPGAGDKERAGLVKAMESGEVEIAAIHDVERGRPPKPAGRGC